MSVKELEVRKFKSHNRRLSPISFGQCYRKETGIKNGTYSRAFDQKVSNW